MGVILFFGTSIFVLLVSFIYTFFVIRHHWRLYKEKTALSASLAEEKT